MYIDVLSLLSRVVRARIISSVEELRVGMHVLFQISKAAENAAATKQWLL